MIERQNLPWITRQRANMRHEHWAPRMAEIHARLEDAVGHALGVAPREADVSWAVATLAQGVTEGRAE